MKKMLLIISLLVSAPVVMANTNAPKRTAAEIKKDIDALNAKVLTEAEKKEKAALVDKETKSKEQNATVQFSQDEAKKLADLNQKADKLSDVDAKKLADLQAELKSVRGVFGKAWDFTKNHKWWFVGGGSAVAVVVAAVVGYSVYANKQAAVEIEELN